MGDAQRAQFPEHVAYPKSILLKNKILIKTFISMHAMKWKLNLLNELSFLTMLLSTIRIC
jgi:hypothetical protein